MKYSLFLAFAAIALSQDRESKFGVVSGTVTSSGGNGISGATVGLSMDIPLLVTIDPRSTSFGLSVVTEPGGRFTLDGVRPGTYRLVVQAPGYLRQSYGAKPGSASGIPIVVGDNSRIENLDVQLTRQSAITGRVLTPDGEPAPNVPVHAVAITYAKGIRRLQEQGQRGSTDSRGDFRVFGLSPGTFYVYADPPPLTNSLAKVERDLPPTYAPSALHLAEALPVILSGGSDGFADIRLRRDRPVTIRGNVVAPGNRPPAGATILLLRDADSPVLPATTATTADQRARDRLAAAANPRPPYAAIATAASNGSFALSGVLPGRQRLIAFGGKRMMLNVSSELATTSFWLRSNEAPTIDDAGVGYVEIVTGREDVDGVAIHLESGGRISTRITGVDSSPAVLVPADGLSYGGNPPNRQTDLREDGSQPLSPGRYFVKINGANVQFYIKLMKLNDVDITGKSVEFGGGSAKLEIVLATDGGTVNGSVVTRDGNGIPGAVVGLWPVTPDLSRMDGGAFATVSSNTASFAFQMVPPGEYYVAAFEDLPDPGLAQYIPFLTQFATKAKRIKVEAKGSASANPDLIPAADAQRVFATLR